VRSQTPLNMFACALYFKDFFSMQPKWPSSTGRKMLDVIFFLKW